jgi:REP element-mobilizing transposase RayT
MARQLRLEYPGAVYHIMSRGNARQDIFRSDEDRFQFLDLLANVTVRCSWLCHAYCLMGNHYHLVIETPHANLSEGMRLLNGIYSQSFNRRHRRVGHLLQGRFKAILVEREAYLLELIRYVVLNPVRATLVTCPEQYPWSSYCATAGLAHKHACLTTDWLLRQFAPSPSRAEQRYRAFVAEGLDRASIWAEVRHQVFLGSDSFMAQITSLLDTQAAPSEVPRNQRRGHRPSLATLFDTAATHNKRVRDQLILDAHLKHAYRPTEIARHLGLHYSSISKIIKNSRFKI